MKFIFFIPALFLNFYCNSQSKADFRIQTVLQDTLLKGFSNFVEIETSLDLTKVSLYGEGIYISRLEELGKYDVRIGSAKNVIIQLRYQISADSIALFDFPFTAVYTYPELINRHQKVRDLPPMLTDEFRRESQNLKLDQLELIIPQVLPEKFDPIILSQNKNLAYLGNPDTRTGSILDLKTRKILFIDKRDTVIYPYPGGHLSNSGRYFNPGYIEYYNNEAILFKDLINQKYVSFHESTSTVEGIDGTISSYSDYYDLNFIDFSPNEYSCIAIGEKNAQNYLLKTALSSVNFKEFKLEGEIIKYASYSSDSIILCVSSSIEETYEDSVNYVFYLNSINGYNDKVTLLDSIIFQNYPIEIKIEHDVLIFGFVNPEDYTLTYQFFEPYGLTKKCEATLPEEFNAQQLKHKKSNYIRSYEHPKISINPEGSYATFSQIIDGEISVYHYKFSSGESSETMKIYTTDNNFFPPTLLENHILFGLWQEKTIYLDQQLLSPFWIDLNAEKSYIYTPPILQQVDPEFAWTHSTLCESSTISGGNYQFDLYAYKMGKSRIKSKTTVLFDDLGSTTFRFGTKISVNYALAERYAGFYDFNLRSLKLKEIYTFPSYETNVRSSIYEQSNNQCHNQNIQYIDSICRIDIGEKPMFHSAYDETKLIYSDLENKGIIFYNLSKKNPIEKIVKMNLLKSNDWIMMCDDNYYSCHFENEPPFQFAINGKPYPFEQFDLKFNRPDIIIDRLGYADSATVQAYYQAYLKRLQKMNFTEDMLQNDFHLPNLIVKNKNDINANTNESKIDLQISCIDTKYKLDRINVWVNDIPIYGIKGIELRGKNIFEYQGNIEIELTEGSNKIQLSILNRAGGESYKETIFVTCTKPAQKPNLYFVGIGVKNYQDSSMNLKFSDKDIRDIADFYGKNKRYGQIFIDTFINEKATKAILPLIKERLKTSTIHDQVIFMYSGHGILDSNLNYYLTTHNIDFMNPKNDGIPYEEFDALLDGIPARQKLMLIDACHSGELDKDGTSIDTNLNASVTAIDHGKGDLFKQLKHTGNSFEIMQELFNDLRRGTGATVISSSAGKYYSFEDELYQNGIYTYALKLGLQGKADTNENKEISINELKLYLYNKVSELTNGKQKPTYRQENLEMDFRVW